MVLTLNENSNNMVVTIEEEKNTFEYQETMNVDVENIANKKQKFWRPIYEVVDN